MLVYLHVFIQEIESRRKNLEYEMYIRVRPGLDSRLDIREPLFEPMGIRERALVGVRIDDER